MPSALGFSCVTYRSARPKAVPLCLPAVAADLAAKVGSQDLYQRLVGTLVGDGEATRVNGGDVYQPHRPNAVSLKPQAD